MSVPPLPLADWSDDSTWTLFCEWSSAGWIRWSPPGTEVLLFQVLRAAGPRPEADVVAATAREFDLDPDKAYPTADDEAVEAEIAAVSRPGGKLGATLQTLERAHHEGIRHRRRRVTEMARTLGVATCESVTGAMDYLVAVGVLCRVTTDGTGLLVPTVPVALPAERLPLTAAEREAEDTARWHELYERTCHRVVGLLGPDDDERPEEFTVTLDTWARRLRLDVEEVRQALLVLLAAPDFSTDADLTRVADDTPFVLTVDWPVFDCTRVVVDPGDDGN